MEKETYEVPVLDVELFLNDDIIATSNCPLDCPSDGLECLTDYCRKETPDVN